MLEAGRALNLPCAHDQLGFSITRFVIMPMIDQNSDTGRHADRSAWAIWAVLVVAAVAILPFAVRNVELVRQLAAMCGFSLS